MQVLAYSHTGQQLHPGRGEEGGREIKGGSAVSILYLSGVWLHSKLDVPAVSAGETPHYRHQ